MKIFGIVLIVIGILFGGYIGATWIIMIGMLEYLYRLIAGTTPNWLTIVFIAAQFFIAGVIGSISGLTLVIPGAIIASRAKAKELNK